MTTQVDESKKFQSNSSNYNYDQRVRHKEYFPKEDRAIRTVKGNGIIHTFTAKFGNAEYLPGANPVQLGWYYFID